MEIWDCTFCCNNAGPMVQRRHTLGWHQTLMPWMLQTRSESSKVACILLAGDCRKWSVSLLGFKVHFWECLDGFENHYYYFWRFISVNWDITEILKFWRFTLFIISIVIFEPKHFLWSLHNLDSVRPIWVYLIAMGDASLKHAFEWKNVRNPLLPVSPTLVVVSFPLLGKNFLKLTNSSMSPS